MATPSETKGDFAANTTLREILNVSDAAMDQAMGIAYQLYLTGRFSEAEIVCKGLIGCDHRYWWSHSLHASILRRTGRLDEALTAVDKGLHYEPQQPKLLMMRAELLGGLAAQATTASASKQPEIIPTAAPASGDTQTEASPAVPSPA